MQFGSEPSFEPLREETPRSIPSDPFSCPIGSVPKGDSSSNGTRRICLSKGGTVGSASPRGTRRRGCDAMEVTQENFEDVLPTFKERLEGCTFLAVDLEFTGLGMNRNLEYYDTLQERYAKLSATAKSFTVSQVGVALFTWDGDCGYQVQAYNFYVFPRPFKNWDKRFTCQASSMAYLAEHNFDFNKFFRDGISFLPLSEKEKIRKSIEEPNERGNIQLSKTDKEYLENVKSLVSKWRDGTEQTLELDSANSYQRLICYQALERFPPLEGEHVGFYVEKAVDERKRAFLRLTRASAEQIRSWKDGVQEQQRQELESAAGFSRVFEMISRAAKPVAIHNGMLDLAYMAENFVTPLPDAWSDFKDCISSMFPGGIADTKYVVQSEFSSLVGNGTSLTELYQRLVADAALVEEFLDSLGSSAHWKMNFSFSEDCSAYGEAEPGKLAHEAGYDAMMTGCLLAQLLRMLQLKSGEKPALGMEPSLLHGLPHVGRVFVGQSDYPYAHLFGEDPAVDRSNLFYVRNLPQNVGVSDVRDLCKSCQLGSVGISLVGRDRRIAQVVVHDMSIHSFHDVVRMLRQRCPWSDCQVDSYHSYQESQRRTPSGKRSADPFRSPLAASKRPRRAGATADFATQTMAIPPHARRSVPSPSGGCEVM